MKRFLLRIGRSHKFKLVLSGMAMAAGLDDLLELWFGMQDVFKLNVAHGVAFTAITTMLDPLADLLEESDDLLEDLS